jgi:hypothetical protein
MGRKILTLNVILLVFLPTLILRLPFAMDLLIFRKISANAIILAVQEYWWLLPYTAVLAMFLKAWNVGFGTWGLGCSFYVWLCGCRLLTLWRWLLCLKELVPVKNSVPSYE